MSHGLKRKTGEQADVELPITPMLDMTFQLMAFFIMTYHPAPQEGQIAMALPAEKGGPSVTDPSAPLELKSLVTVLITSDTGEISSLSIKQGTVNEAVSYEKFEDFGKAIKEVAVREKGNKDKLETTLKIAASSKVKYVHVIAVMDMCLQAGFTNLGFESFEDAIRKE